MIDKLILFIAKQKLVPIKNLATHPLYQEYQKYLPSLKKCYQESFYWHGTGRFHYKLDGESKYEGINQSQTFDVLESIINAGGILPSYDPFFLINGSFGKTISLTQYRMYGRSYAEFNMFKNDRLQYEYGSMKFWYYFHCSF